MCCEDAGGASVVYIAFSYIFVMFSILILDDNCVFMVRLRYLLSTAVSMGRCCRIVNCLFLVFLTEGHLESHIFSAKCGSLLCR